MKSDMERLREKQQQKKRKRILRILFISPLIALVFAAALNLILRVNTLTVANQTDYSSAQISRDLGIDVGDGLFSFNKAKLKNTLTVNYPYIKKVNLDYTLPGTVTVQLEAARVTAAVRGAEDVVLLLDEDFKVLEVTDRVPDGVLLVTGMELETYRLGYVLDENANIQVSILRDLFRVLRENGLYERISVVDLTKKYNISMRLYDVIVARLGNSEDFPQKIKMLINILNENDLTVPAEIRVRNYSEGRYVRLETSPVTDVTEPETSSETDNS